MKTLFSVGISSLLLFACGTQKNMTSRHNLHDVNWMMVDDSGVVSIGEEENAKPLYLRFPSSKANTYNAFLGCNMINGKVSAGEQGQMKFFQGAITRKMCPDMSYETAFLEMIQEANKYQIIDGKLHFYKDSILLMSFKKGKN
ncbi:MAG: META domain-containing protein [Flavobacteriales bacterium]